MLYEVFTISFNSRLFFHELEYVLENSGYTKYALCKATDISTSTYYRYKRSGDFPVTWLARVCKLLTMDAKGYFLNVPFENDDSVPF